MQLIRHKQISSCFRLVLPALLLMAGHAFAEVYRCEQDGKTTFSQTPCAGGARQTIHQPNPQSEPASEAAQQSAKQQLKKDQQESKRLETIRHQTEAKRDREIRAIAAKAEKHKQKCDAMHLQVKWAQEDLTGASPKSEAKARLKLKRATEKTALACG